MKPGIRFKMLAILLLASALPLALGLFSLQVFGYRYYRQNQGLLFQSTADHVARTFTNEANTSIEKLSDWVVLSHLERLARSTPVVAGSATAIERSWPQLRSDRLPLRSILENNLAAELRRFRSLNPLFREVLVTDARGNVIAATNKTSDYIQSEEQWWQRARKLPSRAPWLEGIAYDQSAKIHSLDVVLALRDERTGEFIGAVKGVFNLSALFAALPREIKANAEKHEVVLGDGRILVALHEPEFVPLSNRYPGFSRVVDKAHGWVVATLAAKDPRASKTASAPEPTATPEPELIGFASINVQGARRGAGPSGVTPMFVVVRRSESEILAPMWRLLRQLSVAGGVLLLGMLGVGIWIADRKIINPLRVLSKASRSIARTAHQSDDELDLQTQMRAREAVQRCRSIRTNDEISSLAADFAYMGDRVLSYHDRLEREIAAKTAEIQRDLELAREFQETLLPREYPLMPVGNDIDAVPTLSLNFHHIYKPALSVGGDFFDVFRLSEHQAGIFVADVMGHGARSALVTAILRTLLLDLSTQTADPAELLRLINRHFYNIVHGSSQFVFVSAFCLVLDTQNRVATYANAGHCSPLLAEGATARVIPLLGYAETDSAHTNAALGLAAGTTYQCFSRTITPGDAFLLYTDGVVEAPNAHGDEFGMAQLENVVSREIARQTEKLDVAALCQVVMDAITAWMNGVPSPDDICLVAVGTEGEIIINGADDGAAEKAFDLPYG